ncbi:NXPE family member 4 [Holothuria leucospilota]|uniref:NXPE family member 4 n=1 Tax=Holothuria leucospilota TaxID=206669 RepID=A0A9Q1BIU7_HOLLE|nr:NXPE family member 4 [Holothuria leucospilota]
MKVHQQLAVAVSAFIIYLLLVPWSETPKEAVLPFPKYGALRTFFTARNAQSTSSIEILHTENFQLANTAHKTSIDVVGKFTDNITSPEYTRVTILNPKSTYNLCDRVAVRIEARDSLNRTKTYGGDMFRVKLFTQKPYSAVNPDNIFDYNNGTYLALFRILWEGYIDVQVMLVHPAEVIPLFSPTLNGSRAHTRLFFGGFIAQDENGKKHSETTTCTITKREEPFCNLSQTQTYVPYYCSAPKDKYLNCSHWTIHRTDKAGTPKMLEPLFDEVAKEVLNRTKKVIYRSDHLITVPAKVNSSFQHYSQLKNDSLRYCTANGPPPIRANGYFFQDRWYPFDCAVHRFATEEIRACLKGRTIYFYGDSTGVQIFSHLKSRLKCQTVDLPPPRKTSNHEQRCMINNITLHSTFHGLPVIGSTTIKVQNIHYAALEIDNIVGGPNVIIFLSYWAHFSMAGTKFYEKRITLVKEAIYRLLDRSPETKVVMKGTNTRGYSGSMVNILSSDWHSFYLEKTLRKCFQNDTNFGFIDSWDITQVQPYSDNVHPRNSIVGTYVDLFMTYICKN